MVAYLFIFHSSNNKQSKEEKVNLHYHCQCLIYITNVYICLFDLSPNIKKKSTFFSFMSNILDKSLARIKMEGDNATN